MQWINFLHIIYKKTQESKPEKKILKGENECYEKVRFLPATSGFNVQSLSGGLLFGRMPNTGLVRAQKSLRRYSVSITNFRCQNDEWNFLFLLLP